MKFLLYGANGYTAQLIIEMAQDFGLEPVLAGRSEVKIKPLAQQYGLSYQIADLADTAALEALLQSFTVVLHCAGPFAHTALPMQQACLRTGTHYLDITGEIAVFEQGMRLHAQAKQAGVMLMSGTGFDVVPTDCMALFLKQQLPNANHLQLAFMTKGGNISHGTAKTAVESLGLPGYVRANGQLKEVPSAHKTLQVPFEDQRLTTCMAIPWGDISTAYYTTQIPNIETFMAVPSSAIWAAKLGNYMGGLLQSSFVQKQIHHYLDQKLTGPSTAARMAAHTLVWGKVRNEQGKSLTARLRCPEGYTLTAWMALHITKKVLNGHVEAGYQTPAKLYGADLVLEMPGTQRVLIS
ncbi:MAG: saccharopine dehydrogenase NADP-binding domain-containing protein [Spirosomataceae bacterium]